MTTDGGAARAESAAEKAKERSARWIAPAALGVLLGLPFLAAYPIYYGVTDLLAVILSLTGGIYIGVELRTGRRLWMIIETAVAVVMVILALLGIWWSVRWLALGFALHGVWDLARHTLGAPNVRRPFPTFCSAFDWTVAAILLWLTR